MVVRKLIPNFADEIEERGYKELMELDTNQNIDTAKAYLEGMLGVVYGNNYEIFQNNDSKHKKSIKNQLFEKIMLCFLHRKQNILYLCSRLDEVR